MKTKLLLAALAGAGLIASFPAAAQDKLTVWWAKGFYKGEDDAFLEAVKKFEAAYIALYMNPEAFRQVMKDPSSFERVLRRFLPKDPK